MAVLVKTLQGLAYASVKARCGLAAASIKAINGLDTTSGGGFTPATPAGLKFWFEADDAASGNISSWTDKSGLGNNYSQATSGSRPLKVAAAQNGHAAIRFDGVDDFMQMTNPGSSIQTIVFALQYNKTAPDLNNIDIFTGGPSNDGGIIWLSNFFSFPTTPSWNDTLGSSRWLDGQPFTNNTSANIPGQTAMIVSLVASGADLLDGKDMWLGNLGTTSFFGNFDCYALAGYSTLLSTGDRESVEDYFGTLLNITVSH